jgi:hypothetical protein
MGHGGSEIVQYVSVRGRRWCSEPPYCRPDPKTNGPGNLARGSGVFLWAGKRGNNPTPAHRWQRHVRGIVGSGACLWLQPPSREAPGLHAPCPCGDTCAAPALCRASRFAPQAGAVGAEALPNPLRLVPLLYSMFPAPAPFDRPHRCRTSSVGTMNKRTKCGEYFARNALLVELGFQSYRDYVMSDLWKGIRARVMNLSDRKCKACGKTATSVHHRTYSRETLLGESIVDLVAICARCHKFIEYANGEKTSLREANARLDRISRIKNRHLMCDVCLFRMRSKGSKLCHACKSKLRGAGGKVKRGKKKRPARKRWQRGPALSKADYPGP